MKLFKLLTVVIISLLLSACSGSPESQIKSALDVASGDSDNGMVAVKYFDQDKSAQIDYHFNIETSDELDKQLSKELADPVHKLFTKSKTFNFLTFVVYFPYKDKSGKITWVQGKQVSFDRNTISKVDWSDFDKSTLLQFSN